MSGKWIYEAQSHKCNFPKIKKDKHNPGSIWKCECGLEYVLNRSSFFVPSYCGKTMCHKQGGHPGNCNF